MTVPSRNLLLFLALAGAAFLTWFFSREPAPEAERAGVREPLPEGYYLLGADLHGTDDEGRTYYHVYAGRVEQRSEDGDIGFSGMRVEYSVDTQVHWSLSASRGVAPASRNLYDLKGDILLTYVDETGQQTASLETSEMRFIPDQFRAVSDVPTQLLTADYRISASGFRLDMKSDTLKLAAALMLAAGPALGQNDADDQSYSLTCASEELSINIATDEIECPQGLKMQDGTHIVVAGYGYSKDGKIFRIEKGVEIRFGTVDIEADSATYELDDNRKLIRAEIRGNPVTMSDVDEARDTSIQATAAGVTYDDAAGTLSFKGQATLVSGTGSNPTTMSICAATYNLNDKGIKAGPSEDCTDAGGRLTVTRGSETSEEQPESP
jgi:LPS export ABC transporter protein LptC/lipopolysaccharide transport protein LptA